MAKKKKLTETVRDSLLLIEMRLAVMAHCAAIRAVTALWQEGKIDGAIARLEGACTALEATAKSQMIGVSVACPFCNQTAELADFVAAGGACPNCAEEI